jgi:hypothetical protein
MEETMNSDNGAEDVRSMWQEQTCAPFQMTPVELRRKMTRLERQLLIRDSIVYCCCVVEIAAFGWMLIEFPQWVLRVGSLLVIFGMAFLIAQIVLDQRKRRLGRTEASGLGTTNSLAFYRDELARQRDFHRGIWLWSRIGALFPALLVFGFAAVIALPYPANLPGYVVLGVALLMLPLAIWLNHAKSRNYQCRINAVNKIMKAQS